MRNRPEDGPAFLRARREAMGYGTTDMARLCGISPGFLSNIEAGRRRPSAAVARTIAHHLDIAPELVPTAPDRAGAAAGAAA